MSAFLDIVFATIITEDEKHTHLQRKKTEKSASGGS